MALRERLRNVVARGVRTQALRAKPKRAFRTHQAWAHASSRGGDTRFGAKDMQYLQHIARMEAAVPHVPKVSAQMHLRGSLLVSWSCAPAPALSAARPRGCHGGEPIRSGASLFCAGSEHPDSLNQRTAGGRVQQVQVVGSVRVFVAGRGVAWRGSEQAEDASRGQAAA